MIDDRRSSTKKETMSSLSFLLLIASSILSTASGEDPMETVRRTFPAYAIALNAETTLNSSSCSRELGLFRNAVDIRKLWALKVLDSSGEPKAGFIFGNNYWLGSRTQCFDAGNKNPFLLHHEALKNASRFRKPEDEFPPYKLNYFVAHFRHNGTIQYHVRLPNEDLVTLGLCLPASCTTDQLSTILETIFQERTLLIGELFATDFKLETVRDLKDDHIWMLNARMIIVILILAITLLLMIAGTAYDVLVYQKYDRVKKPIRDTCWNNNTSNADVKLTSDIPELGVPMEIQSPSFLGEVLKCFSVYTNTRIIFGTKLSAESVRPIHGLRFLGMLWIILIHTIFYMADFVDNKPWSWRMSEGFAVQIISNSTLSVDTFFFLGGFLLAYLYFKSNLKNSKEEESVDCRVKVTEFFGAILKRFVRLTPAYMMAIGIVEMNAAWYGETSIFYMSERPQEACAKYWWRNLLYINNFFGREDMCLSWSWYLSNDMQFFIIGTFILMLSSVYFYTALTILGFILVGSSLLTGYISYIYGYVPTMDQQFDMLDTLYDPPWTRIGPYIVGIVTAHILVRLNNKLTLRRRHLVPLWLLGSACNLSVLFGIWERHISVISSAFYVALSRTVWGVGLAWLLIACCTNNGGIINTILSFRVWIPLSRLTYCAYLLNPFLISSGYLYGESSMHIDFLHTGSIFLGNFVATYCCSYAFSLMMETPYALIMRLLTKSRAR